MGDSTIVHDTAFDLICRHEGYTQFPKPDAKNTMEVGHGTNLTLRGISRDEADYITRNDVNRLMNWYSSFPFFARLTVNRKAALLDMAYELGEAGIDDFAHMLAALDAENYEAAADAMLKSKWASQVPTRAADDAHLMREG